MATDWVIIQIYLLKKCRIPLSFAPPFLTKFQSLVMIAAVSLTSHLRLLIQRVTLWPRIGKSCMRVSGKKPFDSSRLFS